MSSARKKSSSRNFSSRLTTCFIKTKILSCKMKDLKASSSEWRNFMVGKFTNLKRLLIWKRETLKKPLFSTIRSSKNSKKRDNSMLNNWPSNLKGKSRISKRNWKHPKIPSEYIYFLKKDLSMENKKLNDILISNKLNFE